MPQTLTVVCKLEVAIGQTEPLNGVLAAFAQGCQFVHANTPANLANKLAVQKLIYQATRARTGLPSQLAILALRRVCANRKTAQEKSYGVKGFAPTSADYDARTFTLRQRDWSISLTTLAGRKRFQLHIGKYQKQRLAGQPPTSGVLVKRRDGSFYFHFHVESEVPAVAQTEAVLGLDLGRTDIAVTSQGETFSGKEITKVRDRYSRVRASLQHKASKGTRSTRRRARRLLQRLSGRERRFQAWLNHTISYRLIQQAKQSNQAVALEDLTGIRERTNALPRTKTERRCSNTWAFYQLRQFLVYKGVKFGVEVRLVDPRYTSKTCHCCKVIGDRQGKRFECLNQVCGWVGDADVNGARNIAMLGLLVSQPGGFEVMSCSLQDVVLRATESRLSIA